MIKPTQDALNRIHDLYTVATEMPANIQEASYVAPAPVIQPDPISAADPDVPSIPPGISPGQPIVKPAPRPSGMSSFLWLLIWFVGIIALIWLLATIRDTQTATNEVEQQLPARETVAEDTILAGPRFSVEYADGFYEFDNCKTWLVYSATEVLTAGDKVLSFDQLHALVEKATSKLHLAGTGALSAFLDANELLILKHVTECTELIRYVGIGIRSGKEEHGLLSVAEVNKGSPAARAGLEVGDLISHIDGIDVAELSLDDAVAMMKGAPTTTVVLKIQRGQNKKIHRLVITRGAVSSDQTTVDSGWLAVYKDLKGQFRIGRSTESTWSWFEPTAPVTESWLIGQYTLVMSVSRPSHSSSNSQVLYSFTFS